MERLILYMPKDTYFFRSCVDFQSIAHIFIYNRGVVRGETPTHGLSSSDQDFMLSAIDEDTSHQEETAILEDRCFAVRQLAQVGKISIGSVDKVLGHLHMQKLFARWVPRLLTPFQKQVRVHCSKALLAMCQEETRTFSQTNYAG
nr:uncharacterized protein LOC113815098 [Penaeus vannamei]